FAPDDIARIVSRETDGGSVQVRRRTVHRLLRISVLATAVAGERVQQIHTITWDARRHLLVNGEDVPAPEQERPTESARGTTTARELDRAMEAARGEIARRMRKPVARLRRRSHELLEERIATLSRYYTDLLHEEGDRRGARSADAEDRERRIK